MICKSLCKNLEDNGERTIQPNIPIVWKICLEEWFNYGFVFEKKFDVQTEMKVVFYKNESMLFVKL